MIGRLAAPVLMIALSASVALGQPEARRAMIHGRVVSATDGIALSDVDVYIVGRSERKYTDTTGRFRFSGLHPGRYEVRARRLGFEQLFHIVTVGAGETRERMFVLQPLPTELKTIRVSGKVVNVPSRFQEPYRRAASAWGDFIFREDIERQNPFDTRSLFYGIPGVHVGRSLTFERCSAGRVQVYVDGIRMTWNRSVDEALSMVHPKDVQIIEVYRGFVRIPAEFMKDACAAVAIWTKSSP